MKLIIFNQWDKLVALLRQIAESAAGKKIQYRYNRVILSGGSGSLVDRCVNLFSLQDESARLVFPAQYTDVARDFVVRVVCETSGEITFEGADRFESEDPNVFAPLEAEDIAVFFFTETEPGVFLVSKKALTAVE